MKPNKPIDVLGRVTEAIITKGALWIAATVSIFMVLLICANIFGRYLFNKPLLGSLEITEMAIVVVVFCVVAYTEVRRGHVRVEVVVDKLPTRAQIILASIMRFIAAVVFVILAWRSGVLMWSRMSPTIIYTSLLRIPFFPFMFIMAFGSILLSLELLVHGYQDLSSLKAGDEITKGGE